MAGTLIFIFISFVFLHVFQQVQSEYSKNGSTFEQEKPSFLRVGSDPRVLKYSRKWKESLIFLVQPFTVDKPAKTPGTSSFSNTHVTRSFCE